MSAQTSTSRHADTLRQNGIVVVEEFMDEETCDSIFTRINEQLESDEIRTVTESSYGQLAEANEPIIKRRTGDADDGMLDIFNAEFLTPELREFKDDQFVIDIINGASTEEYAPDQTHVYVNRSVTDTRGFHADTYKGKFKSFLYLTDVPDLAHGPFAYVKGSHQPSLLKQKAESIINRSLGRRPTDALRVDESSRMVCTAKKGTLIIANQAGYHRGMPQEEGYERMLATTSFTPVQAKHH